MRQVLLSGTSLAVIGTALIVVDQAGAADITISSSITTGTLWSATASPGSNLTVTSSGTINTTDAYGVTITGTAGSQLGTLLNNGLIADPAANGRAIFIQAGSVAAVVNHGTISAGTYAIWNAGSIGTMTNSGLISGRSVNQATIGVLSNSGTLTYSSFTYDNESQIGTLINSGLIYGDRAVYSQGTIGTLVNTNIGTISGTIHAITITGVGGINSIANSGQIIGNILNSGTIALAIAGGAPGTVGTLTGTLGSIGTITSAQAGLLFTSGNEYLNDSINVGTNTVSNIGASLTVGNTLSITGTLAQTAGTLSLNPGAGQLVVNRPVLLTGGTVVSNEVATSNYIAGNYTLVSGAAGSSYSGVTLIDNSITGLSAVTSVSGNNIVTTANNDYIGGTLASLGNTGSIGGATYGVYVAATGSLGTLTNSGTIGGSSEAIFNSGTIGSLVNSGVIAGKIENATALDLTISGGNGATIGTLTGSTLTNQGSIVNTLSNLVFASGNLRLNDNINATGHTVVNSGASLALDSIVSITGAYSQTGGTLLISPTLGGLVASGAANLSGGTVLSTFSNTGNYLQGTYTLVSGSSLNLSGATVSINSIAGLYDSSSIVGNRLLLSLTNDYIGGTLTTLSNAATITGASTGLYVATTGRIGTLTNSGTLGGGQFGINNRGTIGTLVNSGRITNSSFTALWNQGSIGQLANSGTIVNSSWAILNSGTIATLTNSGIISGAGNAIQNNGVITLVNNSGTMSGGSNAIAGTIATIVNSGLILGNINKNGGGSISTIIGGSAGTVGTFTGFSGGSQGTIGASGNLVFASGALLLNDTITAVGIAASSLTVSNTGADITLSNPVSIIGNYSQSAGTLSLGSTGELVVSQAVSITGGTVAVPLSATGNYLAGSTGRTLVSGGIGSRYGGAFVSSGVTGLDLGGVATGTNLLLSYANDYVGGTLASLNNTGSISGSNYGLYVAATGVLGTLTNSGTLSGNLYAVDAVGSLGTIANSGLIAGNISSSGDLIIVGGTGSTVGTLTGAAGGLGTITATGLAFTSGALLLNDNITVGSGTVVNSGASVQLNTIVSISGNYGQSAGTLTVLNAGELVVSGALDIGGGTVVLDPSSEILVGGLITITASTVVAALSSTGNYLANGAGQTLISGGVGSSYSGITLSSSMTGLAVQSTNTGNSLVVRYLNDYVGGSLASLSNTGSITGSSYGVYVASSGSIGTLTNSGTISGTTFAIENLGNIGLIADSGLIAGDIHSSGALTIAGGTGGSVGTLSGTSGNRGTINASGVTFVPGNLLLDDDIIANGGSGLVTNSGSVQVNRPVSISGNYVQTSSGRLVVGVASTSSYGQLTVSGSASLSGAVTIVAISAGTISKGDTFSIVSAGTLSASNLAVGVSGEGNSYSIVGNELVVTVGATTVTSSSAWTDKAAAAGGGATPVGPVLDRLSTMTAFQPLLTSLAALPVASQGHALKQLGVAQIVPQVGATAVLTSPTTAVIEQHQLLLSDSGAEAGRAAGSDGGQKALWGQVLGGTATRDGGYASTSYGVLLGGDLTLGENGTGGLAASWLRSNAKGKGDGSGNRTTADSYQLAAYGAWRPQGGAAFLTGLAAVGQNQFDQKRAIDFLGQTAKASYDGQHYQAKLGAGYDVALRNVPLVGLATATPLASLQYVRSELSGYSESGAGVADLTVKSKGFDSVESEFGGRLATRFTLPWVMLATDIQAGWVHSYTNSPVAVSATMGGVSFVTRSDRPAADGARIVLGASLEKTDDLSIRVEYDGDYREDYRSHTGLLRIRQAF
ncbi:autotransporter domain-containing protein [Telmatospirillum siberiense]|uniref:autotransporter domain-containing protein n=1 Tax=Telmatospirillum siberiense TaxID=382514 RepID=UPI0011AFAD46|nr:autotransporter domain-containing protein [Telmatospirillum siberiense]